MSKNICIVSNTSFFVFNVRMNLIKALQDHGYSVSCIARRDRYSEKLVENGCEFFDWDIISSSKNPFNELKCIYSLHTQLRKAKPDVILCYTIKPNLYASFFWGSRKPVINNITGLGSAFDSSSKIFSMFIRWVYRLSLRNSHKVFLQNPDDAKVFLDNEIISESRSQILPGSGVDIEHFKSTAGASKKSSFTFLLIARMLKEKGIFEFIEAAKLVTDTNENVNFQLLGETGVDNPSAISLTDLNTAIGNSENIKYLGVSDDVKKVIDKADAIVLPSFYREGTPRTLLEGLAMAKLIITTDTPGCRDAVDDSKNGFLCNARDVDDLADKMQRMLRLSDESKAQFSRHSREKAVEQFDEKIVIDHYLNVIKELEST